MEMTSTQITPFAFGDNLVRVLRDENGEPWFVAKDVARALNYQWKGITSIKHVPEEWRGVQSVQTPSGEQEMLTLSEPGLYFFLGRSDKPGALPFQKWLAGEVLPSLRKTGSYTMPGRAPSRRESLPDDLPPDALALRPAMRQRLWQDALQTARLDGADSQAARDWFIYLCRLVAAQPPAPHPAREKVRAFFHQCCHRAEGVRIKASELYDAFRHWHSTQKGELPSKKVFAVHMQEFARRYRSDGSWFDGICLAREGR